VNKKAARKLRTASDLVLYVPGTAVHLYDFAVLDQHLVEEVPNGSLLGHSQIPPLYGADIPP
jgi:hypothetical protein